MKNLSVALMCFLVMSVYAFAGIKMEYSQYTDGDKAKAETNTIILTNDKMIMNNNSSEDGGNSAIFDANKDKLIIISHNEKKYMVIDKGTLDNLKKQMNSMKELMKKQLENLPEAQRKMMEKNFGIGKKKFDYSVNKTNETKTINGWNTSKYNLKLNGEQLSEVWASPIENLGFNESDFTVLKKFANFSSKVMEIVPFKKGNSMSAIFENIEGLPVLSKNSETDETTELKSVTKYTPTSEDFDIPDGYTEQKIPTRGMNR